MGEGFNNGLKYYSYGGEKAMISEDLVKIIAIITIFIIGLTAINDYLVPGMITPMADISQNVGLGGGWENIFTIVSTPAMMYYVEGGSASAEWEALKAKQQITQTHTTSSGSTTASQTITPTQISAGGQQVDGAKVTQQITNTQTRTTTTKTIYTAPVQTPQQSQQKLPDNANKKVADVTGNLQLYFDIVYSDGSTQTIKSDNPISLTFLMASIVNSVMGKVISHIYFGVRGTLTVNNYYGPTLGALLGQMNFAYTFYPKTDISVSASATVGEIEVAKVFQEKLFTQTKSAATWDVDLRQEISLSQIENLVLNKASFTLSAKGGIVATASLEADIGSSGSTRNWITAYSKTQTKDLTPISLTLTSTGFGQSAGDIPLGRLYGVDWTLVEVKTPNNVEPEVCLSMSDIDEKTPSGATITVKKVTARIGGDYEFTFVPSPRITSSFDITNYKVHLNAGDSFTADTNLVDQHVRPKIKNMNIVFTLKSNLPQDQISIRVMTVPDNWGTIVFDKVFTLSTNAPVTITIPVTLDKDGIVRTVDKVDYPNSATFLYGEVNPSKVIQQGSIAIRRYDGSWKVVLLREVHLLDFASLDKESISVEYSITRSEQEIIDYRIKTGDMPTFTKDVTFNVLTSDGVPIQGATVIMSVSDRHKEVQHIEKLTDKDGNARIDLSFKNVYEPQLISINVKVLGTTVGYVMVGKDNINNLFKWSEIENKTYVIKTNWKAEQINNYIKQTTEYSNPNYYQGATNNVGAGTSKGATNNVGAGTSNNVVVALLNETLDQHDPYAYLSNPCIKVIDDYSKELMSGVTVQIYGPWKDLGYDTKTFTTDYLGRVNAERSVAFDVNHEYKITISRSGYHNLTVNVRFSRGYDDKTFSISALNYIEKKEIEEKNKASVTIQHEDGSKETINGDKTNDVDVANAIKSQNDIDNPNRNLQKAEPNQINSVFPTLTIEGIAMLSLSFIVTLAVLYIIITRREK